MLDTVDPAYRLVLSQGGRLVYLATLLSEADAAHDQTEIKRLEFKLKVVRFAHEAQSVLVEESKYDELHDDVRLLVDQMKQDHGAQRLSSAPTLPRQDSSSTH